MKSSHFMYIMARNDNEIIFPALLVVAHISAKLPANISGK